MTIKQIAKKTLLQFKKNNYIFTPDEYREIFCNEAKKYKVKIEDCNKVEKYIKKLSKQYQVIIKNYNIENIDEFITFLISYLNREKINDIDNLFLYTKRLLQVMSVLPFDKIKKISKKHLEILKPNLNEEKISELKSEFLEFLTEYDDSIIKKASRITKKSDAIEIIEYLLNELSKSCKVDDRLIEAIIYSLTPSYANIMNDEIVILNKQLKENKNILCSKSFAEEIKAITNKRLKLDKKIINSKVKSLDQITERIYLKIINLLNTYNSSNKKIKEIYNELSNFNNQNQSNLDTLKLKLLTLAKSLDKEITILHSSTEKDKKEIEILKEKINELENKISELTNENKTDYLTNIANKKAILEELSKQEEIYKRFNHNYSILFIDIDDFKLVNDTYGHEAGDVILKSLGLLFKRYIRKIDFIGRYGGEEFISILSNTDKEKAGIFAEKLRSIVKNTKFMYKNTRIDITISIGIASRNEVNNIEELIELADKRLYLAKKNGKDRICIKDKCD